jgi:hypothetical protein
MKRFPTWFIVVLALVVVVALATPALAAEAKGKIKSVNADKNEFVCTDADGKDHTFTLAATGKITVADKDTKLADLKPGTEVTITYEKKGDKLEATKVEAKK